MAFFFPGWELRLGYFLRNRWTEHVLVVVETPLKPNWEDFRAFFYGTQSFWLLTLRVGSDWCFWLPQTSGHIPPAKKSFSSSRDITLFFPMCKLSASEVSTSFPPHSTCRKLLVNSVQQCVQWRWQQSNPCVFLPFLFHISKKKHPNNSFWVDLPVNIKRVLINDRHW